MKLGLTKDVLQYPSAAIQFSSLNAMRSTAMLPECGSTGRNHG